LIFQDILETVSTFAIQLPGKQPGEEFDYSYVQTQLFKSIASFQSQQAATNENSFFAAAGMVDYIFCILDAMERKDAFFLGTLN